MIQLDFMTTTPIFALVWYLLLRLYGTCYWDRPVHVFEIVHYLLLRSPGTCCWVRLVPIVTLIRYQVIELYMFDTHSEFPGLVVWTRLFSMGLRHLLVQTFFVHWRPRYISSLMHFVSWWWNQSLKNRCIIQLWYLCKY